MSHRRRILNLVTRNELAGTYSLRRIYLHSQHNRLFYPTAAAAAGAQDSKKMARIRPPTSSTLFFGKKLDWFALSESKMAYLNHHTRAAFACDAEAGFRDGALPNFHFNRFVPIVFPGAGDGEDNEGIYVMERSLTPIIGFVYEENGVPQFQAFVRGGDDTADLWRGDELPPPPYVRDAGYRTTAIDSYAVVGGDVCVSTEGMGTYCFDAARRAWRKAGDWTLPFSGKVEHVPKLGAFIPGRNGH